MNSKGGTHTRNDEEDCSTDGGLVVERGTYTVSLTIRNRNTANFDNATVWVIWSPFNGDGKVPSGVDDPVSEPIERGDSEERTAIE